MRYVALGDLPPKRHTQFRDDEGKLLVEEVMGYEGFSGNESILYHLRSPCDVASVGVFEPIEIEEWVPDAHVHRLTQTAAVQPAGDPVSGRRVLMFNDDVEMALCKPAEEMTGFYRNGEGDEVVFVHEGSGVFETIFGTLPYRAHDYVVIPRGTTYRVRMDGGPQTWLTFHTPGEIETSMSLFHCSNRRPLTGSPPRSIGRVSVSRWTCWSGTHSSRTIGVNSPRSAIRHGECR